MFLIHGLQFLTYRNGKSFLPSIKIKCNDDLSTNSAGRSKSKSRNCEVESTLSFDKRYYIFESCLLLNWVGIK